MDPSRGRNHSRNRSEFRLTVTRNADTLRSLKKDGERVMKIPRSDTVFAALLFILTSILVTPLLFMNEVPAQSANHNWDRAYERLKNKDCAGALPYLKRADEGGEDVYWIYNNLVNCLLKNEDRAGALHYARKGMTRYPHETVMRKTLIWALSSGAWESFGDKDYAGAENLFREAYDLDNNDAEVLNGYGVALRESGSPSKLEQSVGLLEKAFSIDHEKRHILEKPGIFPSSAASPLREKLGF